MRIYDNPPQFCSNFYASLILAIFAVSGCGGTSDLVERALDESEVRKDETTTKLMLASHFESTLPMELNADYRALLKAPAFSQKPWTIQDPKARLWCVEATRTLQTKRGKIDPETGKGKITVPAVKERCSPVIEAGVDVEHTCVTVEEAKKHFSKCTVEARVSLTRYVVDLDDEMNFGYLEDKSFGTDGRQIFGAVEEKTRDIVAGESPDSVSRTILESVSAKAAISLDEKIEDAEALTLNGNQ